MLLRLQSVLMNTVNRLGGNYPARWMSLELGSKMLSSHRMVTLDALESEEAGRCRARHESVLTISVCTYKL